MRVLLINPPKHEMHRENIWKVIDTSLPSLGLAYIASYLESRGHIVDIIDMVVENIRKPKDLRERIGWQEPDFIGLTASTVTIFGALSIAGILKEMYPNAKIVLGGSHASAMPGEVLSQGNIDFVIRGEGEIAFANLIETPMPSFLPQNVPNLSYMEGGKVHHNPLGPFIENLDTLPFPAWHLLRMDKYKPSLGNYKRLPAMSVITSRGCPGVCTYCYAKDFGKKIRFRSPENVVKELKELIHQYEIKEISFYDENFTTNRPNTRELCKMMVKEGLDLTWTCSSRVDTIDQETLNLMHRAGCHQIAYGIESADETVLKNLKKHISLESAENAIKMTQKAGIDARANFMFGSPGETPESLEKTMQFAIHINADLAVFNITTPLPGTEMFDWAKGHEYLKTLDWHEYDFSRHIMKLPTVDSELVEKYYKMSHKRFYMRPGYVMKRAMKGGISRNNVKAFMNIRKGA